MELVDDADESEKKFSAEDKLSDNTIEAGYDRPNTINVITLIVIIAGLMIQALTKFCNCVCSKESKLRRCIGVIHGYLFWNFFITTSLELALEKAIHASIRLYIIN